MSPKKEFIPYLLVFAGVFCLFSMLSFQVGDESGSTNWFGRLGYFFAYGALYLLGKSAYLIGLGLVVLGGVCYQKKDIDILGKLLLLPLLILSVSLALSFLTDPTGQIGGAGGVLGTFLGAILDFVMGGTGKAILTSFVFAYSVFAIVNDDTVAGPRERLVEGLRNWKSLLNGAPQVPDFERSPAKDSRYTVVDIWDKFQEFWSGKPTQETLSTAKSPLFSLFTQNPLASSAPSGLSGSTAPQAFSVRPASSVPPASSATASTASTGTTGTKKIYPRYKNASLFDGFFEEERIFRFQEAPARLKRKFSETPDSTDLGFTILDYRTHKSTVAAGSFFGKAEEETVILPGEDDWNWDENAPLGSSSKGDAPTTIHAFGGIEAANDLDDSDDLDEFDESDDTDAFDDTDALDGIGGSEEREDLVQEPRVHHFSPQPLLPKPVSVDPDVKTYVPQVAIKKGGYYISPKLLGEPKAKPPSLETRADSDAVARKIEEIISHYGIQSKVVSLERGPIITRYELTIPNGIKLSKITSLDSELKLYLAVKSIRIVAPIPGKSTIGIEVPNKHREDVHLTDLLRDTTLAKAQGGLSICIGKDIAGRSLNIDLTKLPHLLVAGTTGSGKSVCLNSMVTSLIFSRSPQELRFIMIDPKMVEMTLYEEIPHLLMPVITDPKKATKALGWAIQEMEARYQSVSSLKCRDFQSYNHKVEEWAHKKGYEKMPYIVIVIDELSDLMMVSGKDLEDQITRISQKSRAVGIHLVMATQRPSVDVITGLIKANCPARMAFQVAQKTDSRTILDANGAESLLGKGDFLYRSPTASDLVRVQAPFVTEEEIEKIVDESKRFAAPGYVDVNLDEETSESSDNFDEDEDLIEEAWRVICQEGKASGSMVQRRLRIGYNKAARIIEILEKRGIISPQIGTKPREILKAI